MQSMYHENETQVFFLCSVLMYMHIQAMWLFFLYALKYLMHLYIRMYVLLLYASMFIFKCYLTQMSSVLLDKSAQQFRFF